MGGERQNHHLARVRCSFSCELMVRSGGQCFRTTGQNGCNNEAALQADQSPTDARVDTLLRAAGNRTPIILIAGKVYDFLPWNLEYAYAVLGW